MSAALGFRVKSGWAAAVLLTGPKTAPRVVDSRIVELSDPNVPHSRQPYHAGMGIAQADRDIVDKLARSIERFSRRAIAALVTEHRTEHRLRGAGVVVSSLTDPSTIASPHMRAHASEGKLFRTVTTNGIENCGLKAKVVLERDVYQQLAKRLRRTPARVKSQVSALGDGLGRWRAEQKVATAAAWLVLAGLLLVAVPVAAAQSRSAESISAARSFIGSAQFGKADTALSDALASAMYVMDSVNAFVWRGILEYARGSDSLARLNFRRALILNQIVSVRGLDQIAPGLADVFESEARPFRVYRASQLDEPAAWRSGPALAYPPELRHRRVGGHALVRAVVDTLGHVEDRSFSILESPDSAFNDPLQRMVFAAQFTPGRVKGHAVRSIVDLGFTLNPPAPANPTTLVSAAREQLRARRADSALALTDEALDSANTPTPGERVYALLIQGVAWHAKGRDSLATASFDAGLAGYHDLTARGVELAPFLKRLADSIRISRRASPFASPSVVGAVDEPPVLVSHPPIRYAPEMQTLRIGGTVIVEATLDTTGRVLPATVIVVQSPNPVFNAETKRVVLAAVYRPARIGGHPARVTIRQPVTFAAY